MKHSLGSCCNCGREDDSVRTIFMVDRQSPEPGIGCWGCLVCDLPQAGAVAVLCDDCMTGSDGYPKRVCLGSPADNRRIPFSELSTEPFQHDVFKHAEEESAVPETFPEDPELAGRCPNCERPNQFGELYVACERDRDNGLADEIIDRISSEIEREIKRLEKHQRN